MSEIQPSQIDQSSFTVRAQRVLANAQEEAARFGQAYVSPEHLLLGLMCERDSLAGRLLAHRGVDVNDLRRSFNSLQEHKDITDQISTQRQQREVDALIAVLREEGRKRQPSMSEAVCYLVIVLFAPIILFLVCRLIWHLWYGRVDWETIRGLGLFLTMGLLTIRSIATSRQKTAARKLAEYQDPRTLGELIQFLDWPDETVKAGAIQALTKLLPQLRAGHANLLTQRLRRILYSKLDPLYVRREPRFVIAILKSLEQIGDADALPYVQKLAARKAVSLDQKRVQEAARTCLPFLQERVQQTQTRETLLRASSASASPSEALLRPAPETPTPADQLLRSSEPERNTATATNTDNGI